MVATGRRRRTRIVHVSVCMLRAAPARSNFTGAVYVVGRLLQTPVTPLVVGFSQRDDAGVPLSPACRAASQGAAIDDPEEAKRSLSRIALPSRYPRRQALVFSSPAHTKALPLSAASYPHRQFSTSALRVEVSSAMASTPRIPTLRKLTTKRNDDLVVQVPQYFFAAIAATGQCRGRNVEGRTQARGREGTRIGSSSRAATASSSGKKFESDLGAFILQPRMLLASK
jgi:hypothetical protein